MGKETEKKIAEGIPFTSPPKAAKKKKAKNVKPSWHAKNIKAGKSSIPLENYKDQGIIKSILSTFFTSFFRCKKFYSNCRGDRGLTHSFVFFLIISFIVFILFLLLYYVIFPESGPLSINFKLKDFLLNTKLYMIIVYLIILINIFIVLNFIVLSLLSGFIYVGVKAMRGKGGIQSTFKITAYLAPLLLFCLLIPTNFSQYALVIASGWAFFIIKTGNEKLHDLKEFTIFPSFIITVILAGIITIAMINGFDKFVG